MINIFLFKNFLSEEFAPKSIYIDEFKPDLQFAEIDCFDRLPVKLAIEISTESIKISTIDKLPTIDFSLYDYVFYDIEEAKKFILKVKNDMTFPTDYR